MIEMLTGVDESNKKKHEKYDEMKDAVVNYIISRLHAHTHTHTGSLIQSKRDFSGDKLSPTDFILCAWNVSVCTNGEKEDVKWSLQTGSCSTVRAVVITCWGQICCWVVYSVLANTLKTPLIAQHLACAGGLRVPGNPFSSSSQKKKKKPFRHVI